MPTTLLAQADSCIGSKTSLNFGEGKNQLGTFHPPRYICIDPRFLETLTEAQFRSGIGEIFHYLLVSGQTTTQKNAPVCSVPRQLKPDTRSI